MKVQLRLFAVAREIAKCDALDLDLPAGATIGHLRQALVAQLPGLAGISRHLMFALGTEYATDDTMIPDGSQIACIPPVSGG